MEAKLLEIVNRLETELAPYAYQAVLGVIRVNAAWNAIGGILVLIAMVFIARWLISWWWKRGLDDDGNIVWKKREAPKHSEYDLDPRIVLTGIGGAVLFAGCIIELYTTFNPWTWIGIFNPQLELAREVLARVLKLK